MIRVRVRVRVIGLWGYRVIGLGLSGYRARARFKRLHTKNDPVMMAV